MSKKRASTVALPQSTKRVKPIHSLPALLVFDFDGVLTDNRVLVFSDGTEAVFCHRGDGLGFDMLRKAGVPTLILSKEKNRVVSARANKLKVPCLQGIEDKVTALRQYCAKRKIRLQDVWYVGNDLNDLGPMQIVGTPVSPRDAHPRIRKLSKIKLGSNGGYGAARELVEEVLGIRY